MFFLVIGFIPTLILKFPCSYKAKISRKSTKSFLDIRDSVVFSYFYTNESFPKFKRKKIYQNENKGTSQETAYSLTTYTSTEF